MKTAEQKAAERAALVNAAKIQLADERHWSVVDVEDRAEGGAALADMILAFLDEDDDECPRDCAECAEHEGNL